MWKASKISMEGWWMVTITVRLERATFCKEAAWRGHVQAGLVVPWAVSGSITVRLERATFCNKGGHASVGCHQAGGVSDNARQWWTVLIGSGRGGKSPGTARMPGEV